MIYVYLLLMALGGRTNRGGWVNTFHIQTDAALDTAAHANNAAAIITALQHFAPTDVHFVATRIKEYYNNRFEENERDFRRIDSEERGERVTVGRILPLENVLEVSRNAALNRSGRFYLRGFLTEDDVEINDYNVYQLKSEADAPQLHVAADAMIAGLNANLPDGDFVLPHKSSVNGLPARLVVQHQIGPVVTVDRTRRKQTLVQKEADAAQREINTIWDAILAITGGISAIIAGMGGWEAILPLLRRAWVLLRALSPQARALILVPAALSVALELVDGD